MDNVEGPNKFNIFDLLDQALMRLDAGDSVDAILQACPEEYREELKSLLPVVGGLNDITYSPVPSRPIETRQRSRSQFLMAAAEHREQVVAIGSAEQGSVQIQSESTRVADDALDDTRLATPQSQRPTRTLIEPEAPTFFERISALFAVPTMRLAPFAFVALLLLGGGGYAASTSYAGHWAYPIKEFGRTVGLALVPDAALEETVIAQSEAKQKDILRGIDVANEKNEESNFSQKVIVEKVEQSDDGAILHTNVGDFVVAEGQAPQVLLAAQDIKVGDVIQIDALIMPNDPAPLQVVELEVVATAPPPVEPTIVPLQVVAPTNTPCQPNVAGWQPYTVQIGDTLSALAILGQVDYNILAQRNCIGNKDNIASGSTLYLPPAAFASLVPVNTATIVPTVTVAPLLIEQTPTEVPTVMPEVVAPEVIATPIPSLPTPVEIDGTVTLTITSPVQPTSTIEPTASETTTGPTLTVTTVLTDIPTVVPTIIVTLPVTETATTVPGGTNVISGTVAPETNIETAVPTPTVVVETSPITTTQTITEPNAGVTTDGVTTESGPDVDAAELEPTSAVTTTQTTPETGVVVTEQISVTDPISGTVTEPVSGSPTEVPTVETTTVSTSTVPTLEPTVVPTVTVLPTTLPIVPPTVTPASESSGDSLPEDGEGIVTIVPLTITVVSETPALPAPEVGGASLDPTATQALYPTATDVVTDVVTATPLVPIITVDAELIVAETATSSPIVTIMPTILSPAASPIPVAPPPAQPTVPIVPTQIPPTQIPPTTVPAETPVTALPDTSTAPIDAATIIPSVPVVVEPAVIQPPATTSADSSNQQLQADEIQPTIIEPESPAVSAATAVVDQTTIVGQSTVVPVSIAPTATAIGLAPVSPLTQP